MLRSAHHLTPEMEVSDLIDVHCQMIGGNKLDVSKL